MDTMQEEVTVLFPSWSLPQWNSIQVSLNEASGTSILLNLLPVEAKTVVDELRSRRGGSTLPDLVMLPVDALDPCHDLPIISLQRAAIRLFASGAAVLELDNGVATGLTTFWALDWFVGATNLREATIQSLIKAGRYKDSRLPTSPIFRTSLLFHEHVVKLPEDLGGNEFSLHFEGTLDIEVEVTDANPNEAVIRILDIYGQIPLETLPFDVATLAWPESPTLQAGSEVFSLSLRPPAKKRVNGGMINFQTGVTLLQMSLRVDAPFFYGMGWEPIDIDLDERGNWDLRMGTLLIESGTVALVGGPISRLTVLLQSGAKNQKQTVSQGKTSGWQAVDVDVLEANEKPGQPTVDVIQSLFEQLSKKGSLIGHIMGKAISSRLIKSVHVTYACIETETFQDQEMKEGEWINVGNPYTKSTVTKAVTRELDTKDALLWYGGMNPTRHDFQNALARNLPLSPCP